MCDEQRYRKTDVQCLFSIKFFNVLLKELDYSPSISISLYLFWKSRAHYLIVSSIRTVNKRVYCFPSRIIWRSALSSGSTVSYAVVKRPYHVRWWKSTWLENALKRKWFALSLFTVVISKWVFVFFWMTLNYSTRRIVTLLRTLICLCTLTDVYRNLGEI